MMSKPILFWRTVLLIRHISVFSKDRLCLLSFKSCWVNLVRASVCAITSSRSTEEIVREAKWLYQWKTKCGPLALRRGSWQFLLWVAFPLCPGGTQGAVAPASRWKPRTEMSAPWYGVMWDYSVNTWEVWQSLYISHCPLIEWLHSYDDILSYSWYSWAGSL